MSSDVTVVGAGIFGLACAWALTRRGLAVRVLEADRIGAGSSGGVVGALAPHDPVAWNDKKQIQLDSLIGAQDFWAEVQRTGGVDPGYARSGRLQAVPEGRLLQQRLAGAARHWPGYRLQVIEAGGPLIPAGRWLADDLAARIAPRRALAALAAALAVERAEIVAGTGPVGPGDLKGPVIWATGASGLAALGADLGRPVGTGVKGQAAVLAFDAGDSPHLYLDGLYVVPHGNGTVAVGSTSETSFAEAQDGPAHGAEAPTEPADDAARSRRDGHPGQADTIPRPGTDALLDAVIDRARDLVPALRGAPVIERWAGIRPRANSRAPLLGSWPGRPGHWVANGGFRIGIGMAPWVGEAMADLVLEGVDRIPPAWRVG